MIKLLDDSRFKGKVQQKPKYYAINPRSKQPDFAFSHREDLKDWVNEEKLRGRPQKNFMITGKLSDSTGLFDVVSVFTQGGACQANNKDKILYWPTRKNKVL